MSHADKIPETPKGLKEGWRLEDGILRGPVPSGPEGLVHGFTTRMAGDLGAAPAQDALARREGALRVRMLRQVHGTLLRPPDEGEENPEGDGWVGALCAETLLCVRTADCLPLLLWDESAARGGAVHAGWRGATASIAAQAVAALGGDPARLVALLGPAIGPCCYEVGDEVALAAAAHPESLSPRGGGKFQFDLEGYVRADLRAAGLRPDRIFPSGLCTRCRPELFFSYRGEAGVTGRMAAYVGLSGRRR